MTATGIGASVRRKEDHRFITGKGQYTDDINRPGQTYAYFLRSPHAHATIKSIDASRGAGDARRARGAHRRRPCGRQDRRSDLRLDDPFQGRLADEGGAASGARAGQGALCRRPRRGGHRRDAGAGARTRPRWSRSTTRCCRRSSIRPRRRPGAAADPRRRAEQHRSIDWHLGDKAAIDARSPAAKHVTKLDIVNNRLVPNAMEPRAAIGDYDAGTRASRSTPPARTRTSRGSCIVGLRRHRAGAQAARHRARRRRRLRLEDLHLSRGDRRASGRRRRSAGR